MTTINAINSGAAGSVSSVASGTGLTGGPVTSTGTLSMSYPVSSGGSVTRSLVYAYQNGAATAVTGDGTDYPLVLTESIDRDSNFSAGVFTAPVAGVYLVSLGINITGLANDNTTYQVFLNRTGSTTNPYYLGQMATLNAFQASGEIVNFYCAFVNCSAADTLQPHLLVAGHGSKNINVVSGLNNAGSTTMGIALIA